MTALTVPTAIILSFPLVFSFFFLYLSFPTLISEMSIQKWVGHEDIDTTLRIYAKVKEKEAKKEISSVMNNLIQPKKYSNDQETN